jgi:hypothetical protein
VRGEEYLKNRRDELNGGGRVSEIASTEDLSIVLVYEAKSNLAKEMNQLRRQVSELTHKNESLEQELEHLRRVNG